MIVSSAREITFYFATVTGFRGYDKMPDTDTHIVRAACKAKLSGCADFEKMKSEHIRDFSSLYNRQSICRGCIALRVFLLCLQILVQFFLFSVHTFSCISECV